MRQLLAAQMEITRRAAPVRDRAAMIAELLRQHGTPAARDAETALAVSGEA